MGAKTNLATEGTADGIGARIRRIRRQRGMTLGALAKRIGYTASALSKIENEKVGISYNKLVKLAAALQVDLTGLAHDEFMPSDQQHAAGRRSITRKGRGQKVAARNYQYLYLAPDLLGKRIVPVIGKLRATSLAHFGPLTRHEGEEWIYVLKGEVEVHSEFYEPTRLREGDSIYLDSRMGHAYISKSATAAEILAVYSAAMPVEQGKPAGNNTTTGAGSRQMPKRRAY